MRLPTSLALAVALLFSTGCMITGTPGSGISKTEIRTVDSFTGIKLHGSGTTIVQVGQAQSVKVTIDDNLMEKVKTEVRNGKLHIDTKGSWSSSIGLTVEVTVPQLDYFACSGSGDAVLKDISSPEFTAKITGSGDIKGNGICETVSASISGSGDVDLSALQAKTGAAKITGSGTINLFALESVTASITGSGDVNVHGDPPQIAESVTGSGSVTRR